MLLCLLYLFKRNGSHSVPAAQSPIEPDEPVPQDVLNFEAQVRPGLGSYGRPVILEGEQTDEDIKALMKEHSFNKLVSDVISLKRDLPDTRHPSCRVLDYDPPQSLPTVSVILIFSNEALSAVLRTVWSLILRSPKEMLREIVLVDGNFSFFLTSSGLIYCL